jgi:hypothetical protein
MQTIIAHWRAFQVTAVTRLYVAYRGNFEALTGAALTLVSGKLRGIDSESTQNRRLLLALR